MGSGRASEYFRGNKMPLESVMALSDPIHPRCRRDLRNVPRFRLPQVGVYLLCQCCTKPGWPQHQLESVPMKFPEECLRSCVHICRGISDFQGQAWLIPLVFLIGFAAGRLDPRHVIRIVLGKPGTGISQPPTPAHEVSKHQQHVGAAAKAEKWKHSCSRAEKRPPKLITRSKDCSKIRHRSPKSEELPSPQASPRSESGFSCNSGTSSNSSPLLVGTKNSSPSSSRLPSLETSPVSNNPFSKQRRSELDTAGCLTGDANGTIKGVSLILKTCPKPVDVPKFTIEDDGGSAHFPLPSAAGDGTLPAVAWMCGKDLDLECEPSWLDLVGPSLEDVYGKEWSLLVHPDDIKRCKEGIALAPAMKGPFQIEYRLKVFADHFRWILDIAKPRFSAVGDFLGFVGWRIDIHERKMIEKNYLDFWVLPHRFLVNWRGDGNYFDNVSPALPCHLGYTKEEFTAMPYIHFVHPDDFERTAEAAHQLKEGKAVTHFQNRYRCSDKVDGPVYVDSTGKYRWLMWTANLNFATCHDITGDRLAEEELRKSQQELKRITDLIPGGVFVYRVTKEGQESFSYLSKGALSIQQEAINDGHEGKRAFGMTVHPDDWYQLEAHMRQVLISEIPLDHDYRVVVKEGGQRWVRVHAVPRVHVDGSTEWSGVAWDMTKQHQVVDALKEAKENAEKAAEAKGTFLAHMSHEIRTPMNAVIGFAVLLLETQLTAEQHEYAWTIRSSGEALLGIINDLLDYSKIEAGKMELELQPSDILQCVEDAFDLIAPQAASKSLELTYTISDCVPRVVLGDITRIRQILVNLLSNAVKFTGSGGVSVTVDGHLNSFVVGGGLTKRNLWEIQFSVEDSGIGIPEDRKRFLFQPFTQVDASTTRRYGGTGLGLAICARLCKLHGGRIWVESDAGGSIFRFTIVAEEIPGAETNAEDNDNISSLCSRRVLIVDGCSSSTQAMCARLLTSWHMRPVSSSSSAEALKLLQQMVDSEKSFDAVIFDCPLFDAEDPQAMECLALCQKVSPMVPTLLLTPFGRRTREYYMDRKQPAQFDSYVSKPIKKSYLQGALMNLVVHRDVKCSPEPSKIQTGLVASPSKLDHIGKMQPLRILVAEDNVVNQKLVVKLLLRLGYTADVVGNGREALDAIMHQTYDVCLMDCFMPEMDGLEASRRIRETFKTFPIIVAVTAAALEEEMQAYRQAGMDMCLSKPLKGDALINALNKCWIMKQQQSLAA